MFHFVRVKAAFQPHMYDFHAYTRFADYLCAKKKGDKKGKKNFVYVEKLVGAKNLSV